MQDDISDENLAARLQQGDEAALGVLMDRYTRKLLAYGRRLIPYEEHAGDVVQDVFITVYQNIRDFDTTRKFSPWIYRIAHNAFVDVLRKKKREPLYFFDFDRIVSHPVYEDPVKEEKEKEDLRVLIEKGLSKLPLPYREVIDLYYFENFGYREISDILHIPIGTVGIRLARARAMLKKQFPQNHE